MKKIVTVVALLVLALAMFALVGCGGKQDYGKYAGKYIAVSLVSGGEEMIGYFEAMQIDANDVYIELGTDGKFTLNLSAFTEEAPIEGTYKVKGTTLTLTVDGTPEEGTIKGNKITVRGDDGSEMAFQK